MLVILAFCLLEYDLKVTVLNDILGVRNWGIVQFGIKERKTHITWDVGMNGSTIKRNH